METYIIDSPEKMHALGEEIAGKLTGGEVFLLSGGLGAGKTVLTKGIARGLGVKDEVTSPTFAIHNEYQGRLKLEHFDFYRLESAEEARILGLEEILGAKDSVSVCEWWENVPEIFDGLSVIKIAISGSGFVPRTVVIEK